MGHETTIVMDIWTSNKKIRYLTPTTNQYWNWTFNQGMVIIWTRSDMDLWLQFSRWPKCNFSIQTVNNWYGDQSRWDIRYKVSNDGFKLWSRRLVNELKTINQTQQYILNTIHTMFLLHKRKFWFFIQRPMTLLAPPVYERMHSDRLIKCHCPLSEFFLQYCLIAASITLSACWSNGPFSDMVISCSALSSFVSWRFGVKWFSYRDTRLSTTLSTDIFTAPAHMQWTIISTSLYRHFVLLKKLLIISVLVIDLASRNSFSSFFTNFRYHLTMSLSAISETPSGNATLMQRCINVTAKVEWTLPQRCAWNYIVRIYCNVIATLHNY